MFTTILTDKETGRVIKNRIPLYPLRYEELKSAVSRAGFKKAEFFGDCDKAEYNPEAYVLICAADK